VYSCHESFVALLKAGHKIIFIKYQNEMCENNDGNIKETQTILVCFRLTYFDYFRILCTTE
jgi:hypothetical protein